MAIVARVCGLSCFMAVVTYVVFLIDETLEGKDDGNQAR